MKKLPGKILQDAIALEKAGAFSIVLEMLPESLGEKLQIRFLFLLLELELAGIQGAGFSD